MEATTAIIPTFNRATLLKACLDAVMAQTLPPAEILVVDDGSSDDTAAIAQSFGEPVTFVWKPENSGKARSLNLALERAQHALIWVIDDDDIVEPDALEKLTWLLRDRPEAGFSYGRHLRFSEDETGQRTLGDTGYWCTCAPDDFLTATLEDFFVHQPGMLARKALYDEVGPFDESLMRSQDYDMLVRLARAAPCIGTEDVVFLQRQHEGLRGEASRQFGAAERDAKWMAYDARIFRTLFADIELDEFLPRGHAMETKLDERRALIQRGVVYARKSLWDLAVPDFELAGESGGGPLSADEVAILRRAFASKYGCADILEDKTLIDRLRRLKLAEPGGGEILSELARGLRWRVREAAQSGAYRRAAHLAGRVVSMTLAR